MLKPIVEQDNAGVLPHGFAGAPYPVCRGHYRHFGIQPPVNIKLIATVAAHDHYWPGTARMQLRRKHCNDWSLASSSNGKVPHAQHGNIGGMACQETALEHRISGGNGGAERKRCRSKSSSADRRQNTVPVPQPARETISAHRPVRKYR
jgi:hypothetical protein